MWFWIVIGLAAAVFVGMGIRAIVYYFTTGRRLKKQFKEDVDLIREYFKKDIDSKK